MTIVTLQPDSAAGIDTQIRSGGSAGNNYGTTTTMGAGVNTGAGNTDKSLVKFDLSSIPAGATILSAILTLTTITEDSTTNFNVLVHRSLVEWFEGQENAAPPASGRDGSTWDHRNAIGSITWAGGAGGAAGSDYASSATATTLVTEANPDTSFDWNVAADVQYWVDGNANYGWWILGVSGTNTRKVFHQSGSSTAASRPKLVIEYLDLVEGTSAGVASVVGTLSASGFMEGSATGTGTATAKLLTNEFVKGSTTGLATVSATSVGVGLIRGSSSGVAVGSGVLRSQIFISPGSSTGSSTTTATIFGIFRAEGSSQGTSTVSGEPAFQGQLRGSSAGTTEVIAVGYAQALHIAPALACNIVPLLYLTDGSIKENGQMNMLDFLSDKAGYLLNDYKPQISQYKGGGQFSSSPLAQGRRLKSRSFDNVIDIFDLSLGSEDQNSTITYLQDLLSFQESAANYWVSDYAVFPIYLVARAAKEINTRYAVVHMISVPELENPYIEPFFSRSARSVVSSLTVRIERGHWLSKPPGKFDCVPISSQRSWTISGWQSGS